MIKKNASTAMYQQIASTLRREIASQTYAPGSCIGTQSQLAKRFDVSLITIKKAIELLEKDNLVVSRQGKGTFVQDALLQESGGKLLALSSVFEKQNLKATISIREMKEINTPKNLPENVVQAIGQKCIYVERIHSVEEKVIGYTKIYIPLELGTCITAEELATDSIYHISQTKLGIQLGHAVQVVRAGKASDDVAKTLDIKKDSPILIVCRESYRADGNLLEYGVRFFEHTQYSFRIELDISGE